MQRLANEMGKAQVSRSPEFLGRMIMRQESAGVGVNTTFKNQNKNLKRMVRVIEYFSWGSKKRNSGQGKKSPKIQIT